MYLLIFHNQLDINPLSTTGAVYCRILCMGIYANKYSWRGAYKHSTKHKEYVSVWESHFCQCWCNELILLNNRWPSLKSQFSRSVLLCWTSSALVTMTCKLAVLYMVLTEYLSFFPSAFLLSHNIYLFCHALNLMPHAFPSSSDILSSTAKLESHSSSISQMQEGLCSRGTQVRSNPLPSTMQHID